MDRGLLCTDPLFVKQATRLFTDWQRTERNGRALRDEFSNSGDDKIHQEEIE
jgi:hypothetical protein